MKLSNTIIDYLLSGKQEKAINLWKYHLHRIIKARPDRWTNNMLNNLYGTMEFILNFDPFVKGVVNKRLFLIKSYDYTISAHFEGFVSRYYDVFYKILYNVVFFGKCLIKIDYGVMGYKIKIIAPQDYYVYDGEVISLTDEKYDLKSLIYFGEELFDISAVAISVVSMSIAKEHNDSLFYNNNRYLSGFIHSRISDNVVNNIPTDPTKQDDDNLFRILSNQIVDDVSTLSEQGGVLSTPEGIEIQHKDLANQNVSNSYLQYIERKCKDIENIILGRSTQQNDTSYASEKIRFMSTIDIQFADIRTIENIINTIITHIKWQEGRQDIVGKFEIQSAMDEDEINIMQVLNLVRNLGAVDSKGNPLTIDIKWLSKAIGVPFENKGKLQLGLNTWVQLTDEQKEIALQLQSQYN